MSYNTFGAAIDYINEPCVVVWMWMVSFIGFIGQFICLFINFNLAIQPYIDSKENPGSYMLWGQFFDIITIVNWGLLLSFSTFPIVNLFHQCYKYKPHHNSCFSIFNCFSLIVVVMMHFVVVEHVQVTGKMIKIRMQHGKEIAWHVQNYHTYYFHLLLKHY